MTDIQNPKTSTMKILMLFVILLSYSFCNAQSGSTAQIDSSQLFSTHFQKVIGLDIKSAPLVNSKCVVFPNAGEGNNQEMPNSNSILNNSFEDIPAKAITPEIGRNFKGNQMHNGTPPDNSMAISNSGYIVSFDNASVEYRTENGDSISHFVALYTFIDSSTTSELLFDPKVIYDNVSNRFIAVMLHKDDVFDLSEILVAFSLSDDPSLGWNLYKFNADTLFANCWFDRPNIGINNEDLFISGGIFTDISNTNVGNMTFQIIKDNGYTANPTLICKAWRNIKRPDGQIATGLHPMSYGQSGAYGPGIYLVSTDWNGSDTVYTHHITKNCSNFPDTVVSTFHLTSSYEPAPLGIQPTTTPLRITNCRVADGFFLNNRCHFVFTVMQNGFPAIRYQRINVINNTTVWSSRGFATEEYSYAFPCISSFGDDTTSNDVMIGYLRSNAVNFPSLAVLNYDGTNWGSTTIVHQGNDTIDIQSNITASTERWGDYISMQRRYNSAIPTVWLIGHFGDSLNDWGVQHGWSSWIAEIGRIGVGIEENEVSFSDENYLYPNPAKKKLYIKQESKNTIDRIQILNTRGEVIFDDLLNGEIEIRIPDIENGMYFVRLFDSLNNIKNEKIIFSN